MDDAPIVEPPFHGHIRRAFLLLRAISTLQGKKRIDLSVAEIAQHLTAEPDHVAKAIATLHNFRCIEMARSSMKLGAISWRVVAGARLPEPLSALVSVESP